MSYFAELEVLPTKFHTSLLETLRYYANIIQEKCQLGPGEEIDSSHYVEDTYFVWKFQNCSVNLFWSDETKTSEWLWITITCKSDSGGNLINMILEGLGPYIKDSKIYERPST